MQKEINLYNIRPSTKDDEKGRILQINIDIISVEPQYLKGKIKPILTKDSEQKMIKEFLGKQLPPLKLDTFYSSDGTLYSTWEDWLKNNQPLLINFEDELALGCWLLHGKYFKFLDNNFELIGIEYSIPYQRTTTTFSINPEGSHKLLIKSYDGKINKLITDKELGKITFNK